jgi:DNA-binding MarR family transcriptional regulator
MLNVPTIFRRLNSASKWLVLWVVYRSPGLTGRKIAESVGLAWAPVKNALDWLTEESFIHREQEKKQYRYFPNQNHYLYQTLREIFALFDTCGKSLYRELAERIFAPQTALVALKVCGEKLFFIVRGPVSGYEKKLREYLFARGLGEMSFEIVPLEEEARLKEIASLPGTHFGVPFSVILEAANKAKKLAFFTY